MKIFMILLCIAFFTISISLISKYGIRKKEGENYISAHKEEVE